MRKFITLGVVVLTLLCTAAASAATVPVTSLSGDFGASNPSVTLTPDGVSFGVYDDAGNGGSLFWNGANGLTLADISELDFTVTHNSSDDSPISTPYLRVFTTDGEIDHDVMFDPTKCATTVPAENVVNHYEVTDGDVRYDDDSCDGVPPDQQSWATVVAQHGSDTITGIYVTTGFAGGQDLSALLSELSFNGTVYRFGAPVAGPPGNPGGTGASGSAGPPGTTTVVIQNRTTPPTCHGDELRIIHAPSRRGEKFLNVRATLIGKSLKVIGRSITVDLRNKPEANYNVRLTSRYRTRLGHVRTVKSTRNLSVVCA